MKSINLAFKLFLVLLGVTCTNLALAQHDLEVDNQHPDSLFLRYTHNKNGCNSILCFVTAPGNMTAPQNYVCNIGIPITGEVDKVEILDGSNNVIATVGDCGGCNIFVVCTASFTFNSVTKQATFIAGGGTNGNALLTIY